ncbi:hypothetical protein CLU81_3586 [Flavobacterium sp. 9]|uniref:hypothetical protein n=1 Tax=Flavobacterium sp. 9 TaxID=2035198 RepID=UPI000C198452|nr:hypothetical protein [Flavobacterium sp. 9]PIF33016.1 hypothetical protein CLU81_3586 [Flavobacterium sp. 9]
MENVITIEVKVVEMGEYNDFQSWLEGYQAIRNNYGITTPLLHQDRNGYTTNGYDLKNFKKEAPYPVKTYLLVQDPDVIKPMLFKSTTSNEES